ncbi:MAG: hypothetical protein KDC14_13615, partial [Planctomycetes bacterium]|nr:hypothetical protein [Planctomycetota bacterium]
MLPGEKLLKRGLHRSVWLSACGGTVIKRFRSDSVWRRATDGRRARREARMLARLAELDLAVPRLVALQRSSAGWEVHSAAIAEARSLEELLGSGPDSTLANPKSLGAALARFHTNGFLHGDLHPGNLLATRSAEWFLIDVSRGRIRTPLPRGAALDELAGLLAAIRERTTPAWRAELWRAWRDGTGATHDASDDCEWRQLELVARRARHRSVLVHQDRWLRPSSRLRELEVGGESWLVARRAEEPEELLRSLVCSELSTPSHVASARRRAALISGPDAERQWRNAARAGEHGLPGLRTIAWCRARSLAVLEALQPGGPRELRASDGESAALFDALADRGLWTPAPPLVERAADGRL